MSPGIWHWCCCGGQFGDFDAAIIGRANADSKKVVLSSIGGSGTLESEAVTVAVDAQYIAITRETDGTPAFVFAGGPAVPSMYLALWEPFAAEWQFSSVYSVVSQNRQLELTSTDAYVMTVDKFFSTDNYYYKLSGGWTTVLLTDADVGSTVKIAAQPGTGDVFGVAGQATGLWYGKGAGTWESIQTTAEGWGGVTWSGGISFAADATPFVISTGFPGEDGNPAHAMVYVYERTGAGVWTEHAVTGSTMSANGTNVDIAIDKDGGIHVIWAEIGGDLRWMYGYSAEDAWDWDTEAIGLIADLGSDAKMVCNRAGLPEVLFRPLANGEQMIAAIRSGRTWMFGETSYVGGFDASHWDIAEYPIWVP